MAVNVAVAVAVAVSVSILPGRSKSLSIYNDKLYHRDTPSQAVASKQ